MKLSILLFLFLVFPSCKDFTKTSAEQIQSLETFDWLVGSWIRTNDSEGTQTFENWNKVSDRNYLGESYTLKGKDTIFKEDMQLSHETGKWNLIVTGVNEEPTTFHVLIIENNRFIAENPMNDFPKRITYFTKNDKLTALISAEKKNILFNFERIDQK